MLRTDDLMNGYHILQDTDFFCFGIDAVLLSHYPALKAGDRVMDLGTGFAPIPLIMHAEARRQGLVPGFKITGLELQERPAEIAARSVAENHLSDEIEIVRGDIREAEELFGPASFSLVTCNPPYMPAGDGIKSADEARAIARTEIRCTLEDVIRTASALLKMRGRFAMIHRPFRLPEIMACLTKYHLEPKRMRMVHPAADTEPSMVLIESVKGGRPRLAVDPPLIVYNKDRTYTEEIYKIYGWNPVSGGDSHRQS
ncbi:MAG: tRNA1(Val) (adenine(37)-N6)-methyltransferase [Lachnospiraceae bacterium]|nr:tRNA1(Val) (adenine(37)-N6)-methyltransferase [Lachnospiraceae bacterium]